MASSVTILCGLLATFVVCLRAIKVDERLHEKGVCTCESEVYRCSHIKHRLPAEPSDCKKLRKIEIIDSEIKTLTKDFFNQSSTELVKSLKLSNCSLSLIEPDALEEFPGLQELDFSNNKLNWTGFVNGMNSSMNLSNLHLDGNALGKITGFNFSPSVYRMLNNLTMTNCHIDFIVEDAFEKFLHLTVIHLNGNYLTNLDFLRSFKKPRKPLSQLFLSYNNITDISVFSKDDRNFSTLSHITSLSLDGNPLELHRSHAFSALNKLELLWLQNLRTVDKFPKLSLPHLKNLRLCGSSFRSWSVDAFQGLRNLRLLDMSKIDLSGLSVQRLEQMLQPLWRINSLILSKTGIKGSIRNMFNNMSRLKTLYLDNNQISNISYAFSGISKMRSLYLNNNNISIVDPDTDLPGKIESHLDLYNNPFHCTCALANFRFYLSRHLDKMWKYHRYNCRSPKEYAGKSLFDFNPLYSDCHGFNPYVVTAIVVCVVLILVVLTMSIINSNKDRIRRYWAARKLKRQYSSIDKEATNTNQVDDV